MQFSPHERCCVMNPFVFKCVCNWECVPRSDHQQAMAERASLSSMLAKSQTDLPPKRMKDSYLEVHLPLGSEPQLREKYLTFHNTVR